MNIGQFVSGPISKGYVYSIGDMVFDPSTGDTKTFDGSKWMLVSTAQSPVLVKKTRMIEKLKDEKIEDILDTMLTLLIRANILRDVDEFKEMIEANKLATDLSNN